jgi:hypothetical protein
MKIRLIEGLSPFPHSFTPIPAFRPPYLFTLIPAFHPSYLFTLIPTFPHGGRSFTFGLSPLGEIRKGVNRKRKIIYPHPNLPPRGKEHKPKLSPVGETGKGVISY